MHVQREREGEGVRAEREPPRNERERRAREYLSTKLSEEESTRTSPPRILRLHVLRTLSEVAQSRRKLWYVCVCVCVFERERVCVCVLCVCVCVCHNREIQPDTRTHRDTNVRRVSE